MIKLTFPMLFAFPFLVTASPLTAAGVSASGCPTNLAPSDRNLAGYARTVLHEVVRSASAMEKIHAAEILISYGEVATIRQHFEAEAPAAAAQSPYRIGVWRVLAQTASSAPERAIWIKKIETVFLDPDNPDRPHAIESLCKLHYPISGLALEAAREMATTSTESEALLAWWAMHLAGDAQALQRVVKALKSRDHVGRLVAAYILRWVHSSDPAVLAGIARAANSESPTSAAYPYMLTSAVLLNSDPTQITTWQDALERLLMTGSPETRFEASQGLLDRFQFADLPKLIPLLTAPEPDTRAAGARIILHVTSRMPHPDQP